MKYIAILIWIVRIAVHGELQYKNSYSPVEYYTEEACVVEVNKINRVAYKHLNAECRITCADNPNTKECFKAMQEYKAKKSKR